MNNKYNVFKQIIRECNYDSTYKMAWAKSLVEIATEIDFSGDIIVISLESIAQKFIKYYWNQTIFFDLVQGSNLNKPPVIVTIIKKLIEKYLFFMKNNKPEFFEKAESKFKEIGLDDELRKVINEIVNVLKQDVSWRFNYFNGEDKKIYKYSKWSNYIEISSNLLMKLRENEQDLYDLINYRWGIILESFNTSPRINKKVKIKDERNIKRSSLNKFKKYLDLENDDHKCFSCDRIIEDDDLAIDHVIPWSYMYSDDLWNLVYICRKCNSIKSNKIPTEPEIKKLNIRNKTLLSKMKESGINSKKYDELKLAIEKDYVNKFWIGSRS